MGRILLNSPEYDYPKHKVVILKPPLAMKDWIAAMIDDKSNKIKKSTGLEGYTIWDNKGKGWPLWREINDTDRPKYARGKIHVVDTVDHPKKPAYMVWAPYVVGDKTPVQHTPKVSWTNATI